MSRYAYISREFITSLLSSETPKWIRPEAFGKLYVSLSTHIVPIMEPRCVQPTSEQTSPNYDVTRACVGLLSAGARRAVFNSPHNARGKHMRSSRFLAVVPVSVFSAALAIAQTTTLDYVTMPGSNLRDSVGAQVTNATISLAPVNESAVPISFHISGSTAQLKGGSAAATGAAGGSPAAGVNDALFVRAAPYYAKCNGTTNDLTAIQAAFNDAISSGKCVQFPAGVCKTGTVRWKGQCFYGAGPALTTILGEPGQDVFAGPDSAIDYASFSYIHDLTIEVDSSVNAAATAAGGNNTFPNRITGTNGGTTPLTNPPAPGPMVLDPTVAGNCGVSATAASATVTSSCAQFAAGPSSYIVRSPISIMGAGASGGTYTGTVASVVNENTITVSPAPSTTVSSAKATLGNPPSPPWYIGNCGFAIPQSDGSVSIRGVNGWRFENVIFTTTNGNINNTCDEFIQAPSNDLHYTKVEWDNAYGGLVEAFPVSNFSDLFAWTPDTNSYRDVNFKSNTFPAIMYNGTHRVLDGFSIYGGEKPFTYGLFEFSQNRSTYGQATISRYYDECFTPNSGEHSRFVGIQNIVGGMLDGCGAEHYVRWDANNSVVNAQGNTIEVNGNNNTFTNGQFTQVIDNGSGNSIDATTQRSSVRYLVNHPHPAVNRLDAGFLVAGNSASPFTSSNDLLVPCEQFNFAFQPTAIGCTPDPSGTEITKSYFHATSANYLGGWVLGQDQGSQGQGPYGKPLIVGDRLPQAAMNLLVIGRCNVTCTHVYNVYDYTKGETLIGGGTVTFGTIWTPQLVSFSTAAASVGDSISVHTGSGLFGSGVTYEDTALMAFEPINTDTIVATINSSLLQQIMRNYFQNGDTLLFPCTGGMVWGGGSTPAACSATSDATSPTGQAVTLIGASGYYRLKGYASSTWSTGSQIALQPYVIDITAKAAAPTTLSLTLLCNGTSLGTPSLSLTTTYQTFQVSAPFNTCSSGQTPAINIGMSTVSAMIGAVSLHPQTQQVFKGTTGSIGGSSLAAGTCATGTAAVAGAASGMDAKATPTTYPGAAFTWSAYVSSANTVTVSVCTALAAGGTPTASTYNVRVIQ